MIKVNISMTCDLPVLDLIHVDNGVRAIECVIRTNPINSFSFNTRSGIGYLTFEIAKIIKEICESDNPIMLRGINDFNANIIMYTSKASEVFGWHPII